MDLTSSLMAALEINFSTLPQQLVNGILLGAIYALVALGYTMVYGVLRLINFAHGEVFMLGAYTALLGSWFMGYGSGGKAPPATWVTLLILLVASMLVCGIIGVVIEFFAYRPMRNQPRIAALITAIGVSLFLQYGGALVLPNAPPPSVPEKVNPIQGTLTVPLIAPEQRLRDELKVVESDFAQKKEAFEAKRAAEGNPNDLSPEAKELRTQMQDAERAMNNVMRKLDNSGVKVTIPWGQLAMFITTIVLMIALTYLVLFTKMGRGMRAVSHDFDTAGLMGVNVSRVVSFTFLIGSMLAGAGAMMNATFIGTPLTTFYGLQFGVKAFVAAVLGGIGNIPGAVLGGLLMGVAETTAVWLGLSSFRDAIAFVILIVVLLFRPGGLLGSAKVEKV